MTRFLKKTFVFIFVSIMLIIMVFFVSNQIMSVKADFKFSSNKKFLIVGHSHPQCAYNDSIIDCAVNFSSAGETYFYTYPKIKRIINQNPNIKTVFVEYTNNQISEDINRWIWGSKHLSSKLTTYLPLIGLEDLRVLVKNNRSGVIHGTSKAFRRNLINVLTFNFDYTKAGGYLKLVKNEMDSLTHNVEKGDEKKDELSKVNIHYLEKIIKFCNENGVKVCLIRSPQHKDYIRENEKEFLKVRNEKFKEIDFLDFNDFSLKDEEYADHDHLNYKGAIVFSLWFNDLIDKGLLNNLGNNAFINKEMKVHKEGRLIEGK